MKHIDKVGEGELEEGRGTCIRCVRPRDVSPSSAENFDTRTREQQVERSRYHHENDRVRPTRHGATASS